MHSAGRARSIMPPHVGVLGNASGEHCFLCGRCHRGALALELNLSQTHAHTAMATQALVWRFGRS